MPAHTRLPLAAAIGGTALLFSVFALVGAAGAANQPFTQGDANALFYGAGGPVVSVHNPV